MTWLKDQQDVQFAHVNTAPRWRTIQDLSIPKRLVGGCLQGLRDAVHVVVELIRFRPDVIHLTTSGSLAGMRDIGVMCLAHMFRVPTVYHIRFGRIPELVMNRGWEWRLLNRALRMADKVMVLDSMTESSLQRILPKHRFMVVPNGIVLGEIGAASKTGKRAGQTVCFLGWVIPTKGIQELIDAWQVASRPGWELRIAGPGDEEYRQALAGRLADGVKVTFLGELPHEQGAKLMQEAEVFVLPSYTEGFPNVILEAMAAGQAIVATRVGAIPDMLDADTTTPCGIVVEPRNPKVLAEALCGLMDDAKWRSELGQRARAKVERSYDARGVFDRYVAIWRSVAFNPEALRRP